MRSEKEIKERREKLLNDPALRRPLANVAVDAGLALVQTSLESATVTLKWVTDGSAKDCVNASVVDGMLLNYLNVVVNKRVDGVIEYRGMMQRVAITKNLDFPNCGMPSHHQPCNCEGAGGDR